MAISLGTPSSTQESFLILWDVPYKKPGCLVAAPSLSLVRARRGAALHLSKKHVGFSDQLTLAAESPHKYRRFPLFWGTVCSLQLPHTSFQINGKCGWSFPRLDGLSSFGNPGQHRSSRRDSNFDTKSKAFARYGQKTWIFKGSIEIARQNNSEFYRHQPSQTCSCVRRMSHDLQLVLSSSRWTIRAGHYEC